jgi:hypothetical protein
MLRREFLDAIENEEDLSVHRVLDPQGAVVVEHGDAFCRFDVVFAALVCHFGYELKQRGLGLAFVP